MHLVLLSALYLVYMSIVVFNTYTLKIVSMWRPCIFMGHEFETHYIILVPLYETARMPQSDQQTMEDQGSAGDDQLNSDIRDASDDDKPCAANVGTANEKQSAHSFGESVDDQQCVDNRRKADETSRLQMVSVM